ncbi:23S rRNA m(5)U-1939 methyltransferase [Halanaerobium sp. DL-01]|uniref:23S rRNA (uracil(1939)-C(5))-methyltransferase RlmD n=1 Tax=Halanaerobium sp. DL-01 TaxID=1653064 RepID=UPI000DF14442|nr:23S rRNA (uracil(1939)-C(5))-methyltransferase RlmD [Halanaerobium sp. DL-01]RCW82963.1 23S rRNA m(5)U-1939 methyltransferase [Halanaerobium sp. DL-01]
MVKKNDIYRVKIEDLANGGDGVGRIEDNLVVFVPLTLPGDYVKIKITYKKKNFAQGELIELIESSPDRIEPPCPVFDICGGCQIQHINYKKQLEFKKNMIYDLMARIGELDNIPLKEIIPYQPPFRYRNKAQFPLTEVGEEIVAGFYQRASHSIVPYNNCLIQHPLINRILRETLEVLNKEELSVYDEKKGVGLLRHLIIRAGVCTNQALLTFVTSELEFPNSKNIAKRIFDRIPELKGVTQNINIKNTNRIMGSRNINLFGENKIKEYIGKAEFVISPSSFFQVNTLQAEKLYKQIFSMAEFNGGEKIVDAFSGTGSIAVYLAQKMKKEKNNIEKIYCIENSASAVKDGKVNIHLNSLDNIEFIEGEVEKELGKLLKDNKIDLLVFDPPRKGLEDRTVEMVKESGIEKVIYVSCNPATQARDLKNLKSDYKVEVIQPVDMFPQTYHVESVALLKKFT